MNYLISIPSILNKVEKITFIRNAFNFNYILSEILKKNSICDAIPLIKLPKMNFDIYSLFILSRLFNSYNWETVVG